MFTKRIIPCLDIHNGRVVKGVNFVNLKDAGNPVEIAEAYNKAGADELVFLDITASSDARSTVIDMVRQVAQKVFIPFTVGGGVRTIEDFKAILREGADKISVNSAAITNPFLIEEAARKFGRQCVVVAIDAKRRLDGSGWNVYKHGGRIDTSIDAVEWAISYPIFVPSQSILFNLRIGLLRLLLLVLPSLTDPDRSHIRQVTLITQDFRVHDDRTVDHDILIFLYGMHSDMAAVERHIDLLRTQCPLSKITSAVLKGRALVVFRHLAYPAEFLHRRFHQDSGDIRSCPDS